VSERQQLVKDLLQALLPDDQVAGLDVVAMTPREYFASLKKWC
jgi:hypothetical protein